MISNEELKRLVRLLQVDLIILKGKNPKTLNDRFKVNPLLIGNFREMIRINHQDYFDSLSGCPSLYQDSFGVCYSYFEYNGKEYFIGPMSLVSFPSASLRTYLDFYELEKTDFPIKTFLLDDILELVSLIASLVTGNIWKTEDLLACNRDNVIISNENSVQGDYQIKVEELIEAHHTYQEERHLLEYVRQGAVEEALAYQNTLDKSIGRLSNREVTHWRNLAIVAITLTTRAAIDGGLPPSIAYKISDSYIRQCGDKQTIAQLINVRNQAVTELTENVRKEQKILSQSSYIKASTNYIHKHYREKIYLEEVADFVGLSSTYFSKLFKKEVGISFQQYVIRIRLEYAANLLRYSNESITVISEYVHFPSQSYFGRYFKDFYHITPKEYRDLYHISDKN